MWDTVESQEHRSVHLSHDMPCPQCGHALHTYLECGDGCDCVPVRPSKYAQLVTV